MTDRQKVFELIIRQALSGAPWREIYSGIMQVNHISAGDVEAEVLRRQNELKGRNSDQGDQDGGQPSRVSRKPKPPDDSP
jgi:hypothetical protein